MTPEVFKRLLERYSRGECTQEEIRLIEKWYDRIPNQPVNTAPEGLEERLWATLKARHNLKSPRGSSFFLKIAASITVILAITASFYLKFNSTDTNQASTASANHETVAAADNVVEANNQADPKKVTLEDGSVITLQPGATLTHPRHFLATERTVSLNGEAFFDIKRDVNRPFFVYSKEVVTKVLGTSFNVRCRDSDSDITVAVKSGKVSVYKNATFSGNAPAQGVILTPNQQAVFNRKNEIVSKQLVDEPEIILKRPTLFTMDYDGAPVTQIFQVIEENYGVEIVFDSEKIKDCILTTKMSKEGLFERIDIICKAINATYSVDDDAVIRIEGSGCK